MASDKLTRGVTGATVQLSRLYALSISAFAALLMVPALLSSPMTHDSFWIDWVWADQFTAELAAGNPYPRWLPQSHGGLGSPVFYYYPPLAFYLTGLFGLLGLSTYSSIIAAFFTGQVASGFAMHAWLRENSKAPLLGSLIFMAAPYHLLDFYGRGALAEFLAIALIPLLALGLRRAARGHYVLATLSYAAMILMHVPLALLVSIFFVAPYGLYLCRQSHSVILRLALPLLAAMCVAAIYLLPALLLEPYRDAAKLWTDASVQPENWGIFAMAVPGPSSGMRAVFLALLLALAPAILILVFSKAARTWGVYGGICWIVAAGLIPGLWSLPLIEAVQFPFRLLPLVEFAVATGFARIGFSRTTVLAAASPAFALSVYLTVVHKERGQFTVAELAADHPDVPENLPPGDRPFSWPSEWALQVASAHRVSSRKDSNIVEPVFYFPSWEVTCDGRTMATSPEPRFKLLMHDGGLRCRRRHVATPAEKIGWSISLLAILALTILVLPWGRMLALLRHGSGGRVKAT